MGRAKKEHYKQIARWLKQYAAENDLYYARYSEYHMRIAMDEVACLDAWTTGKYYVKETDYSVFEADIIERGGETGWLEVDDERLFFSFLDKLFNPIDFA